MACLNLAPPLKAWVDSMEGKVFIDALWQKEVVRGCFGAKKREWANRGWVLNGELGPVSEPSSVVVV